MKKNRLPDSVIVGGTEETEIVDDYTMEFDDEGVTTLKIYTYDNAGRKSEKVYNVKIDKEGPEKTSYISSDRETNKITAHYSEVTPTSGIQEIKCYYGTGEPTSLGTANGNDCVFEGLEAYTEYNFKQCVTSKSNITVCSDVSTERTLHNFYTITVVHGTFADGTSSKSVEETTSITATASGLPSTGWSSWSTVETGKQKSEYRTYSWVGDTTKTITVTKDETITFDYDYTYSDTKYRYYVTFNGSSSLNRWTNDNGNGTFTFPSGPSKTGHTFQGWSTSSTATSGISGGTSGSTSAPITYYPTYSKNSYTISVTNGRFSDYTTSKSFYYQDTATAYANDCTWTGFSSYTTDKERDLKYCYTTTGYSSGATQKSITVTGTSTITFYSYTADTHYRYRIRFKDSKNTSTEYYTTTSQQVWTDNNGGGTFTLPAAPSKDGYEFVGWNKTSSSTTGTAAGTSQTVSAATTYYAIWKEESYKAADVTISNSYTTKTNAQDAMDELYSILK